MSQVARHNSYNIFGVNPFFTGFPDQGICVCEECTSNEEAKNHARLQIKEIIFSGNHIVEKDTTGNFTSPEWVDGRIQDNQAPVCYTRNKPVMMTPKFGVIVQPLQTENILVKGSTTLGTVTIEWNSSVTVNPEDTEVVCSEITSNSNLPDCVGYYDNTAITWEINPNNSGWSGAGISNHMIYVTLGDPFGTSAHWTLLEISCKEAHEKNNDDDVVANIFEAFRRNIGDGNGIIRMRDNKQLKYWARGYETDNKKLLSGKPEGKCGNWSNFLLDMYRVNGIKDGVEIIMHRSKDDFYNRETGFLVNNWEFSSSGTLPVPFTHEVMTECKMMEGIKAQGMNNTQPFFFDHVIVKYKNEFYDPSYGVGPFSNMMEYEKKAIAGLGGNGYKVNIKDFEGNLIYVPKSHCSEGFIKYTVKRGDNLSMIAKKYGIASWETLYYHTYNENFRKIRTDPDHIIKGDLIYIPFDIAEKVNILQYFYLSSKKEIESRYRCE